MMDARKLEISELNKPGLLRADGTDMPCDPRLRNFASGEFVQLDTTPFIEYGCPENNTLFTNEYKAKPRVYTNYNDIDVGLIVYRTDQTTFDPFQGPALNMDGSSVARYFKTPDNVVWTEAKRIPRFCKYNYLNIPPANVDTQLIRENIMAEYASQLNRHRFLVMPS